MYLGLRYPNVFGKLAVISPSVWWDNKRIVADVEALKSPTRARIWLDMGTDEGEFAARDARRLRDALVARGWRLERDLKYFAAVGAKHSDTARAERVHPLLRVLVPTE